MIFMIFRGYKFSSPVLQHIFNALFAESGYLASLLLKTFL